MNLFLANGDTYLVAECYGDAERLFCEIFEGKRLGNLRLVSDIVFVQDFDEENVELKNRVI